MIGLTDTQLQVVMRAARSIPVEKRDTFLQRIAAMLALRGRGRFTDTDVAISAPQDVSTGFAKRCRVRPATLRGVLSDKGFRRRPQR